MVSSQAHSGGQDKSLVPPCTPSLTPSHPAPHVPPLYSQARNAVRWDVIVTIAAAFGISKALQNSGVAGTVAAKLVDLAEVSGTGRSGLLVAVYLATSIISNIVTNNAAAALMFPIAAEAAERQARPRCRLTVSSRGPGETLVPPHTRESVSVLLP
jgi:di/tricarboxylate transporter